MLIHCPKCHTSYDIGSAVIPPEGKKVCCSQCGEVWFCLPEEAAETPKTPDMMIEPVESEIPETVSEEAPSAAPLPSEPPLEKPSKTPSETKPAKNSEMQDIFARLEAQTETLFKIEKNQPLLKKIWHVIRQGLGLQRRRNRQMFVGGFLFLFLLTLFYLRYEVVRIAPFMEKFYEACHIDCVIPGEGLEFQNITRNEYEEDYISKMEIRGFITNVTTKTLEIPTIQVQLLDKNAQPLQILHQEPSVNRIIAGSKVAFRIMVTKPSTFSKYVYLTFTREHPADTIKAINTRPLEQ